MKSIKLSATIEDFKDLPEMEKSLSIQLALEKRRIINNKLTSLGIYVNNYTESIRRFRSIICEVKGNEEIYYYNDGSIEGLHIVTLSTIYLGDHIILNHT